MIYLNGHTVSQAGISGDERFSSGQGTTTRGGELGFWPWGTAKWRYFFGMDSGRVVSRQGPVWLSDYDAGVREADIVQRGLSQGRSVNPVRYDWDESARTWRQA